MIRPVSGRKPVGRVLGGDPALQGGAAQDDPVLGQPEVARVSPDGDPHLGLHEVDVGDLLGDRVLDLDARVHLDEDVVARPGRAGTPRCRRCGSRSRSRTARRPRTCRSRIAGSRFGRRGDLDDLLVPALHRAVPLEEVDDVARRRRRGSAPRCAAGSTTACSMNTVGSPKAPSASRMQVSIASRRSVGARRRGACPGRRRRRPPSRTAGTACPGRRDERVDVRADGSTDASVGTPAAFAAAIARALLPVSVEHLGGRADEGDAGVRRRPRRAAGSPRGSRSPGRPRRRRRCTAAATITSGSR